MSLKIDGGILAGGLSTRMDGRDKGLQLYGQKPMAQSVFESLQPYVRQVIINCNRNQTQYRTISPLLYSDSIEGFQGPLAGLHSLMLHSDADYLLLSPCDTPCLGKQYGQEMLAALHQQLEQSPDRAIIIASKDENRHHPLHLCISTRFVKSLEQAILNKQNRVMKWVNDNGAVWLDFSTKQKGETSSFVNFNTLEELSSSQ